MPTFPLNQKLVVQLLHAGGGMEALVLPRHTTPVLDMASDAEVKLRLRCTVAYSGVFSPAHDRLRAFWETGGQRASLGVFCLTGCEEEWADGIKLCHLTAMDESVLCRRGVVQRPYFAAGSQYTMAVRQLLYAAGVRHVQVDEDPLTFPVDREDWEPGTPHIRIINELLREMGYHSLYGTPSGILRARRYTQPGHANVSMHYALGNSALLPGLRVAMDAWNHPNRFLYSCDNPDLPAALYAQAVNEDINSPFCVQRQGEVPVCRRVHYAANTAALQRMAEVHRMKSLFSADEVRFSTGINPAHSAFEVVHLQTQGFSGLLAETAWRMELVPGGVMHHTARRLQYAGAI